MFSDLLKEIEDFGKVVDYLKDITITFGNINGNGSITVNILNTDDTTTTTKIDVDDAIYLTENGTLTIPAKPFMYKIRDYINKELDDLNEEVLDFFFDRNFTTQYVRSRLEVLELKINVQIPIIISNVQRESNSLNSVLNTEQPVLINMNELSKYVSCKINFK